NPNTSELDLSLQDRQKFVPKPHRELQRMHISERKRPKIDFSASPLHFSDCLFESSSTLHDWLSELFILKQGKARAGALALRANRASSRATFPFSPISLTQREGFEFPFRQECEVHLA